MVGLPKLYVTTQLAFLLLLQVFFLNGQEAQSTLIPLPESLALPSVHDVIQTNDGKLWLANATGLYSFDGKQLIQHKKLSGVNTLVNINHTSIGCVLPDQFLIIHSDGTSTTVKGQALKKKLLDTPNYSFFEYQDGFLGYFDGEQFSKIGIQTDTLRCLSKGVVSDIAWGLSDQGFLIQFVKGKPNVKGKLAVFKDVKQLLVLDKQRIGLVAPNEIQLVSIDKHHFGKLLQAIPVKSYNTCFPFMNGMLLMNDNELHLVQEQHEQALTVSKLIIKNYGHEVQEFEVGTIQKVFNGIGNSFWILDETKLRHIRINSFGRFSEDFAFGIRGITSSATPDERIYVAAGSGYVIEKENGKMISKPLPLADARIGLVNKVIEVNGRVWIASSGANLYVMENGRILKHIDLSDRGGPIFNLYGDQTGNVWVCQAPEGKAVRGILKIDPAFHLKEYTSQALAETRVLAITESGNQLFMGARGKQSYIFQYHPASDEFKNISLPLPFKVGDDFEVHDLVADQTGMIWLASSKGLLKHDGKAIKHIALEQSNLFECVQLALAPDSSIWLGTNGFGVYRYKNGEYARFGSYEGIPSKISSYRAMLFDQDGRLWFGTHEGMVISNYHFNTHTVPKPELKRIASGYKRISSFDKPVQLPYRTPIYFTLASSSFPYHRQRYEYEVLHWQKEQKSVVIKSEGTHDHEITLNPLEGGTYELRARSLQLSGQMRSEPLIYKFTVQPIWYKRPWVLIAFALLMTLGMILIIRWNTLRLKASNSRLERKVDTRTKALLQSEEELRQNAEELKAINTNLERTQQNLQESLLKEKAGRKALEQTFLELKSAQDQLIESEKLAALGNLLAGVAHEINSPLGAIRSSSSYLVDCITFFEEYPKKFDKLAEEQKNHLFVLMEFAMRKDSLELFQSKRKARKELAKVLESYGIETNHELLESLLQIGIKHPSEAIIQVLQAENANEVIELAQEVSFFIKAIRNVNYGSERALKIVTALKNYARKNSTNDKQLASLKEGIESTLILYQHHIRHNTKLIWEYDEIPPIYCYPDELNQVWTNLFNNAIQAMESVDDGKLTVFLRKIGNQAQVTVKDNGKGIPDRVKARIFEPFFTTKPSGIGTGIGLDIVKKIIDKHQGRIELDSIEGKGTTIKIIIPLREPENG